MSLIKTSNYVLSLNYTLNIRRLVLEQKPDVLPLPDDNAALDQVVFFKGFHHFDPRSLRIFRRREQRRDVDVLNEMPVVAEKFTNEQRGRGTKRRRKPGMTEQILHPAHRPLRFGQIAEVGTSAQFSWQCRFFFRDVADLWFCFFSFSSFGQRLFFEFVF